MAGPGKQCEHLAVDGPGYEDVVDHQVTYAGIAEVGAEWGSDAVSEDQQAVEDVIPRLSRQQGAAAIADAHQGGEEDNPGDGVRVIDEVIDGDCRPQREGDQDHARMSLLEGMQLLLQR